jgi:hypothetical protein
MKYPALLLAFLCFTIGCATTKIDWNSRVGNYTYDQAVVELGVPDRYATLSDGTIVAEWLRRRGGAYGTFHRFGYSRFETYDLNQMPDSYLRLVFGPDKQLQRWEKFAR